MQEGIRQPYIFPLPKIADARGNLTFLQNWTHFPFEIRRVYWIYDVPGGEVRGSHAFKTTQEVIIALSGSFDAILHDGIEERVFHLNRAYYGLFVPQMLWRTLANFSTNAVALILASTPYDESDYVRDFEEFKRLVGSPQNASI
ncbi:MAG: FdtA/QdtA family cupin domain-containing protein [Candidatus Methanomethylicaceae archaeon]